MPASYLLVQNDRKSLAQRVKDYADTCHLIEALHAVFPDIEWSQATWRVVEAESIPDLNAKLERGEL